MLRKELEIFHFQSNAISELCLKVFLIKNIHFIELNINNYSFSVIVDDVAKLIIEELLLLQYPKIVQFKPNLFDYFNDNVTIKNISHRDKIYIPKLDYDGFCFDPKTNLYVGYYYYTRQPHKLIPRNEKIQLAVKDIIINIETRAGWYYEDQTRANEFAENQTDLDETIVLSDIPRSSILNMDCFLSKSYTCGTDFCKFIVQNVDEVVLSFPITLRELCQAYNIVKTQKFHWYELPNTM